MEKLKQTPSQTVGPFFAYSLTARQYGYDFNSIIDGSLIRDAGTGERIYIAGGVFDGNGNAIPDAMIELWQADGDGNYRIKPIQKNSEGFIGFGRLGTGTQRDHRFSFTTIKPGSVNEQSPHINVMFVYAGLTAPSLHTTVFFG